MIEGLATPTYRSLIRELDRQRERRGWPIWKLEERAGLSESHLTKLLGEVRLGTWSTLELIIDALYPEGCRIKFAPLKPTKISAATIPEHQLKILRAYQRHWLAQIAPAGGYARAEKLTRARRQEIGKLGAQARWRHKRKLAPRAATGSNHNGQHTGTLCQLDAFDPA
jgi:hypothetical protein